MNVAAKAMIAKVSDYSSAEEAIKLIWPKSMRALNYLGEHPINLLEEVSQMLVLDNEIQHLLLFSSATPSLSQPESTGTRS